MADADEDRAEHDDQAMNAIRCVSPPPISSIAGTPSSGARAIHNGPRFSVNMSSNTPPIAPMQPAERADVGALDAVHAELVEEHTP